MSSPWEPVILRAVSPARTARNVKQGTAGLTLVEVTLLISVIAVVLAASGPAFVRAIRISKVAEAPYQLARLQQRAAAYYAVVHSTEAGPRTGCVPEPAGPTPTEPSASPVVVMFEAPENLGAATWQGFGFSPDEPIRFRYSVVPSASGCDSPPRSRTSIVLRAEGDLDHDGTFSLFERALLVVDGELTADPLLFVRDRIE